MSGQYEPLFDGGEGSSDAHDDRGPNGVRETNMDEMPRDALSMFVVTQSSAKIDVWMAGGMSLDSVEERSRSTSSARSTDRLSV